MDIIVQMYVLLSDLLNPSASATCYAFLLPLPMSYAINL